MSNSPDVNGPQRPASHHPDDADDTVAAETLAASPFPRTEQIDQVDATVPVDDSPLAWSQETGAADDMVPFTAGEQIGAGEQRRWRRLPLLAFIVSALAALVALGGAAVVLTSTSRTEAPATPSPSPAPPPSSPPGPAPSLASPPVAAPAPPTTPPAVTVTRTRPPVVASPPPTSSAPPVVPPSPPPATTTPPAVQTPAPTSPSPTAPPMTTRYLRVPFVPVPIPVQVPSTPYQPPPYP